MVENVGTLFQWLIFLGVAFVSILASLLVITRKNPIHSAVFLVLTFLCVAVLYLLLYSQFIAIIQIVVYAGAIVTLILFVIMLLNLEKEKKIITRHRLQKIFGVFLGIVLLMQIGMVFHSILVTGERGFFPPEKVAALGNTEVVARLLFTDFLLPFEITSVLLLVAIIGAIILAKREI
jgi:NADH-quinone oxidoreductase subunit J